MMLALRKIANLRDLFQLQGYLFSQKNKLEMSNEAQKAVWAWKIITTIETSNHPQDIFAPSLKDILIDLPDPSPQYNFDKEIKKQMLIFFGEGVQLSSGFKSQNRIYRAREAPQKDPQESKFTFCPNYLVTQPMLKLLRAANRFLLVSGCYGISKTISLVLYSNLVKPINAFYYKARSLKDNSLLQEIKTLEQKELLRKQPKYWYWTINWPEIQEKEWRSVMDSLIGQAHELSEEEITTLRRIDNLKEFIVTLKAYYKEKHITSWIIIDQINGIASYMRKWNEFIFDKGDLLQKIRTLNEEDQIQLKQMLLSEQIKNQRPAKQLAQMFTTVKLLGNGFVLNSSINIEKSLIQNPYKHANEFPASHTRFRKYPTLMLPLLEEHEEVVRMQIDYRHNLRKQFGKSDFWHFFWFEVQRNLLQRGVSREKLSVAKRIFIFAASKTQIKGFYRNIYVFDCLRTNPLTSQLSKMIEELPTHEKIVQTLGQGFQTYFSFEELKKMLPFKQILDKKCEQKAEMKQKHPLETYFLKYLRKFEEFARNQERQRLVQFMNKGNTKQKKRFLLILVALAERSLETNSPFSYPIGILNYALGKQLSQFFMSQENNQELLPARSDQQGIIHFEWTSDEFIALALPIIAPEMGKNLIPFFSKTFSKFYQIHPVYRGVLFQLLVLCQLQPQTKFIFPIFQDKTFPGLFFNSAIEISKSLAFMPFNVKVKSDSILQKEMFYLASHQIVTQQSIADKAKAKAKVKAKAKKKKQQSQQEKVYLINLEQHLQQVMIYCNQDERHFVSAIPTHEEKYFFQSESIDFLFAVKRQGQYEIFAFDVTVGSYGISDKIKAARDYLERLISSKHSNFVFNHYILAPKQKCSEKIIISDTVSIRFACVDDFKIENSQHEAQKFILEELQKINVLIRKRLG